MRCDDGCMTENTQLHTRISCQHCRNSGWTPGNGRIYPWPRLTPTGVEEANDERALLLELSDRKRTRLNLLDEDWNIGAHRRIDILHTANQRVAEFGLRWHRLHPEGDIESDEPLVLVPIVGDPFPFETPNVVAQMPVAGQNAQDLDMNQLQPHLDELRSALQTRDINVRNVPNSEGFREQQLDAISRVLTTSGSLTIAALPTGFGKTRIAQAITWALRKSGKGPALMVSPLISLMDDQRDQWRKFSEDLEANDLGLHGSSGLLSSFLTSVEETHPLDLMTALQTNRLDMLCCSPETLMASPSNRTMWVDHLCSIANKVSFLVVDEAHVVGDWGASIRPDFQFLKWVKHRLLSANPDLRILLMSATLSQDERQELTLLFGEGMHQTLPIEETKTRPDLYFHVELLQQNEQNEYDYQEGMNTIYNEWNNIPTHYFNTLGAAPSLPPVIVYTPLKSNANGPMKQLAQESFGQPNVKTYTGDTSPVQRERVRESFLQNQFSCMVATSAFGMGIDKPDVWITSYLGMPFTVKGLYQGFGRAARKSHWDGDVSAIRSGACFGLLHDSRPRNFRRQLGERKSLERLFDLFLSPDTIILENGYILLPITRNIESKAWRPNELLEVDNVELDEVDDTSDDYTSWRDAQSGFGEDFTQRFADMKRYQQLYKNRMWVLSCLMRSGDAHFFGIHRREIATAINGQDPLFLTDALSQGGYDEVKRILSDLPTNYRLNTTSQKYAVVGFDQRLNSWQDLVDCMQVGHHELHTRYRRGADELGEFIEGVRNGDCIRTLFAHSIGADRNRSSCEHLGEDTPRVMPCINCRTDGGEGFLWTNTEFNQSQGWEEFSGGDFTQLSLEEMGMKVRNNSNYIRIDHVVEHHEIQDPYFELSDLSLITGLPNLYDCTGDFDVLTYNPETGSFHLIGMLAFTEKIVYEGRNRSCNVSRVYLFSEECIAVVWSDWS